MSTTTRTISAKDTAAMLRKALRATHPGVKFSVRTNTYSGGASLDVKWTDGPTEDEVRATTELYRGATFDGMTDSKHHHETLIADESGDVQSVRFAADFVHTYRALSPEFVAAVASMIAAQDARGRDSQPSQCRRCGDWKPADFEWFAVRDRAGFGRTFVCSPECGAHVEARYGHVRPRR